MNTPNTDHLSAVKAAEAGQHLQNEGAPDPFPPEGTDDKALRPDAEAERPFSDAEATKATRAALKQP